MDHETEVRQAVLDSLRRLLDGKEPECSLIADIVAQQAWIGDPEAFKAAVKAKVLRLDAELADWYRLGGQAGDRRH